MLRLNQGQRVALTDLLAGQTLQVGLRANGAALDFACFGLDANGALLSDDYMVFFNQPNSPCLGVRMRPPQGEATGFMLDLARLPATLARLVVTASIDGPGAMGQLQDGDLRLLDGTAEVARYAFGGADFAAERALMLGEFYRRDGQWRFMAVGQGFNGGLDALVRHFGAAVAPIPVAVPVPIPVSLEKRIMQEAPQLVNLVKQAGVSLDKAGLAGHRAKVCLCLDISLSMHRLYKSGLVQRFAERILALGCQFDDDGAIDVFLFGKNVHQPAPMGLANCQNYVQHVIARHRLEGDTRYGAAMSAIRAHYFPDGSGQARLHPLRQALPVYVMFLTDGGTSDRSLAEKQLRWSSMEPIFWQFMGIGKGRKSKNKRLAAFADADFPLLESLDVLPGRLIDNANFFSVSAPDEHADGALYELLMTEYPAWLRLARRHGLLI